MRLSRIYRVNAERMEAALNLRVVAKHGVGLDNILCQRTR